MLTNTDFFLSPYPLPWKQSNMAIKQKKLFDVCVKGIGIDTDAHHVYFVRSILSYVAFCIFNEYSFNICKNMAFSPQLKHHKTKNKTVLLPNPSDKIKITIQRSTTQNFIALTLFKSEQASVVVKAQTLPIFNKIYQNRGNRKSVSNLYWQFVHNKTHFWLQMYYLLEKTLKISPNLKSLK